MWRWITSRPSKLACVSAWLCTSWFAGIERLASWRACIWSPWPAYERIWLPLVVDNFCSGYEAVRQSHVGGNGNLYKDHHVCCSSGLIFANLSTFSPKIPFSRKAFRCFSKKQPFILFILSFSTSRAIHKEKHLSSTSNLQNPYHISPATSQDIYIEQLVLITHQHLLANPPHNTPTSPSRCEVFRPTTTTSPSPLKPKKKPHSHASKRYSKDQPSASQSPNQHSRMRSGTTIFQCMPPPRTWGPPLRLGWRGKRRRWGLMGEGMLILEFLPCGGRMLDHFEFLEGFLGEFGSLWLRLRYLLLTRIWLQV